MDTSQNTRLQFPDRQHQCEFCSSIQFTFDANLTGMKFHDAFSNGQAQPAALRPSPSGRGNLLELLKYDLLIFFAYANAVVLHSQQQSTVLMRQHDVNMAFFGFAELDRIGDKIDHDLDQLILIACNGGNCIWKIDSHEQLLIINQLPGGVNRILDNLDEIKGFDLPIHTS